MASTSTHSTSRRELSKEDLSGKHDSLIHIIQYCKDAHIHVSPLEYLSSNHVELQKLVEYLKGENSNMDHSNVNANVSDSKPSTNTYPSPNEELVLHMLFKEEESYVLATSPS